MKTIRWGILGVSNHVRTRILPPVTKSTIAEIYGIASRSLDRARDTAKKYGINTYYGQYEELVKDPKIQAVYIPLPNHLHVPWIKKAADEGKHILCEKPLALGAKEAEEAFLYVKARELLLMEAFMYQLHPRWRRTKEMVNADQIGAIQTIQIFHGFFTVNPLDTVNRVEFGGGAFMDLGCYSSSVSRFLLDKEPIKVFSLVHRDPKLKTDSVSSGIIDFGSARTTFTVSTQAFPYQRIDIFGTRGVISLPMPFNPFPDVPAKVEITTEMGSREILFPPVDQYGLEFDIYSRAIAEKQSPPITAENTINNLKVIEALLVSEETGTWEKLL